jgi:hypothetical protein
MDKISKWKATMLKLYNDESGIAVEMARRGKLSSGGNENSGFARLDKEERVAMARKAGSKTSSTRRLSNDEVMEIRASDDSLTVLAKRFSISASYVSRIKKGDRYKDVR